jgi:hypothetical protein
MYPDLVGKECFVSPVSKRFVEYRKERRKAFAPFLKRKKKGEQWVRGKQKKTKKIF